MMADGFEFVVNKAHCHLIKERRVRIKHVFGVDLELKEIQQDNQWINIKGPKDMLNKAKDFILAIAKPEATISLKHIYSHPSFTTGRKDEIERSACAVLSKVNEDDLSISGTELSVMLAQSLIDEMFSKSLDDDNPPEKERAGGDENFGFHNVETADVAACGGYAAAAEDWVLVDDDDIDSVSVPGNSPLDRNNSSFPSVVTPGAEGRDKIHLPAHLLPWTIDRGHQTPSRSVTSEPVSTSMYASASAVSTYAKGGPNLTVPSCQTVQTSGAVQSTVYNTVSGKGDGNATKSPSLFPSISQQAISGGQNKYRKPGQGNEDSETGMEVCSSPAVTSSSECIQHALNQQKYLRDLGHKLHYLSEDIEKGLASYDMDNVVKPADFLRTLNKIKAQRHGISVEEMETNFNSKLAMPSLTTTTAGNSVPQTTTSTGRTRSASAASSAAGASSVPGRGRVYKGNDSVICIGSVSDDNSCANTIIISSDDEENDRQTPKQVSRIEQTAPKHVPENSQPPHINQTQNREPELPQAPAIDRETAVSRLQEMPDVRRDPRARGNSTYRYIVVDGSNVAMAHGQNRVYSVEGIRICILYFLNRGHDRITVFVPEWRRYGENLSFLSGKSMLETLNQEGFVKFTPSRRINGRTIASYDDRYILNLAEKEDGIIVSNDQFRDLCMERPSYKRLVENRLLQFTFVEDHFMPPDDPLGRFGPHLDEFLRVQGHGQESRVPLAPQQLPRPIDQRLMARQPPGVHRSGTLDPNLEATLQNQSIGTNNNKQNPFIKNGGNPMERRNQNRTNAGGVTTKGAKNKKGNQQQAPNGPWLPLRSEANTTMLYEKLVQLFPDPAQADGIRKVLNNHKRETDVNILSNYCINALFS